MKANEFLNRLKPLINSIDTLEKAAGYSYDWYFERVDFDYNSPDENQLYYEVNDIMSKLNDVKLVLEALIAPIKYESRLTKNGFGKYEDIYGHYYSCGTPIEYLYIPDDEYDNKPRWCFSRVEHDATDYYIVGYNKRLDEVLTRVREYKNE